MNVAAEQGAPHSAPHAARHAMPDEPLLRLNSVGKRFPGVIALQNVSFDVRAGEVHAICGENGAGKSTLMKIVSGQYRPDEGEIYIDGREHHFASTLEAQAAGIAIIHQELNLIPHLSIAENIFLAREPKRGIFIDRARLAADSQAALDRIGLQLLPRTLVGSLSVAQQQMIEIAKALSLNARLLIMDEPTSSLTESETVHLFRIIKELRQAGVGIVYISHRLDELAEIADRVTVLRDGRTISTDDFAATTIEQVVSHMVGRDLDDVFPERKSQPTDEVLLSVSGLSRRDVFGPVSFELRRGEILGFAGLMGSGRTEVARAVFGADPVEAGEVQLQGKRLSIHSPIDAIRNGIAYLSEDRKGNGLALQMTVAKNITLANVDAVSGAGGFIRFEEEAKVARKYVDALGIRTPSVNQITRNLSGGNQQKVVISKWLFRESKILFFDEPTRGIDVAAKFEIMDRMLALCAKGLGILFISSEVSEVVRVSHRIAVLRDRYKVAEVAGNATSEDQVYRLIAGGNQ